MAVGEANWTTQVASRKIDGSPTVLPDGAIVIQSLEPKVYVFEPGDGSLRWEYDVDESANDVNMYNGIMYWNGDLFFGSRTNYIYQLTDAGDEVRSMAAGNTSDDSTPVVFPDGTLMCSNDDDTWYFFDESMNVQATTTQANLDSTPVVDSAGNAYAGQQGTLYKFDSDANILDTTGTQAGGSSNSFAMDQDETTIFAPGNGSAGLQAYDPDTLSEKWSANIGAVKSPATVDEDAGRVYVKSQGGDTVYAINMDDGSTAWTFDHSGSGQAENGVALDSTGRIYSFGADGVVYGIDPDGSQAWAYDTGTSLGDLFSCPAIDGEQTQLYVGDNSGVMHAIDINATAKYEYNEAIQYPFYFQNFRHNAARIQNFALLFTDNVGLRGGGASTPGERTILHDEGLSRGEKSEVVGDQVLLYGDDLGQS